MAKAYIKHESSTHIRFDAYTHAAYAKEDKVAPLDGGSGNWIVDASDDNGVANGPVTFDIGRLGKVASIALTDLTGTAAVKSLIYHDGAGGGYTMTATGNTLAGIITHVGATSVAFLEAV